MANEEKEQDARSALLVVQSMIDISADRLEGLRTQCATSAELTQQEIRTLEVSLSHVSHFILFHSTCIVGNIVFHLPVWGCTLFS